MKGTIIEYSEESKRGKISGFDGIRYQFDLEDWRSEQKVELGLEVDFEILNSNAIEIIVIPKMFSKEYGTTKRTTYILLGLFFGVLGAHNFYANRGKYGLAQSILYIVSFLISSPIINLTEVGPFQIFVFPIVLIIMGIWILIEVITVRSDGNGLLMS